MGAGELSAYVGGVNFSTLRAELRREGFSQRARGEGAASRVVGAISAQRARAALAVADEHLLLDGALRLNVSARLDGVEDAEASSTPSRALLPTVAGGVVVAPTPWLELRANGARTARPPDLDELYLETEVARGDPGLRPEVALTLDAGARVNLANAALEAVYFQSDTADEIFFAPVTAYLFAAQNLASVARRGVEVSGEARWGRLGAWGRYGWTRARLDSSDPSPLPGVPEHTASLRVTGALGGWGPLEAQDAAGVEAGGAWRSEVFLDLFGRRANPAWLSVDAAAWVGPWRGWRVRVDATNLLDYRGAVDARQRPLPGRAFHVSLTYRLGETDR
jgi:outer membrane receptor protein involved in Fe transport